MRDGAFCLKNTLPGKELTDGSKLLNNGAFVHQLMIRKFFLTNSFYL